MKGRYPIAFTLGPLLLIAPFPASAVETSIYVNNYFEIRDHNQPTKYVFNRETRVARVTGSLSPNIRIQRFRLRPGWNLLSLAVSATNLSHQLQSPGVVDSAHSWNAQTGGYLPVPEVASSGMVLWVNATTNATLSVVGAYSDPVHREVSAGATYLSGPGLEAWTPNFPGAVSVWHFSPQPADSAPAPFGPWRSRLAGDLSAVNDLPEAFPPGRALYVINQAPFELEIPDPALRIRYYHQDHLGSSSVMTDASGALVEETAFYPFGIQRHEHRLRPVEESYKFTQKERDRESGLHYFEARYLTGGLARFMTQDPKYANPDALAAEDAAAFLATPQTMNMYAYAGNNPLSYVDPTGLDVEGIVPPPIQDEEESTFMKFAGGASTVVVNFCDNAFGCGMGGYQLNREILTQGYKVETDSKLAKVSAVAGTVATVFIPSPIKGPVAAPGTVTLFAKAPIAPMATGGYRPPTYAPSPPPTPKTLPGPAGKASPAAAEVANANRRAAAGHANWDAAVNANPKSAWTQATIDATRNYRDTLPLGKERQDQLRSIYDAADALFK
jgi:RHS repeat-associated protein